VLNTVFATFEHKYYARKYNTAITAIIIIPMVPEPESRKNNMNVATIPRRINKNWIKPSPK